MRGGFYVTRVVGRTARGILPSVGAPARRTAILLASAVAVATAGLASRARAEEPAEAPARQAEDPYPEEFRRRVDAAVDRGVERLLARQRPDGAWESAGDLAEHRLGVTALCTLACLHGGVPPREAPIERAFGYLRTLPLEKTYDVGVLLMALHARHAVGAGGPAKERDRYGHDPAADADPCRTSMTPQDREWMERAVAFLLANRDGGRWGYPRKGVVARPDLSNTQYALLGLWAAARCGVRVPTETWLEILESVLAEQERTGPSTTLLANEVRGDYRVAWTEAARARGFRYRPEEPTTGAMTTAGLACLAICQEELWTSRRFTPEARARTRRAIRDALAWLQDHFDVAKNPGLPGGGWHLYYLYGLERAGILARSRFVGAHDWYREGATWLLERQRRDGSWQVEHVDLDTAFAVLFLRRSTQRPRNAAITPSEPAK
jgi:hypothetical protein